MIRPTPSVLALLATAAACGAPDPALPEAPVAGGRHRLGLEFEPALAAPGELHYAHECGEQGVVPTGRAGVELSLPPGPVLLRLLAGGRWHDLPVSVPVAGGALRWRLPSP